MLDEESGIWPGRTISGILHRLPAESFREPDVGLRVSPYLYPKDTADRVKGASKNEIGTWKYRKKSKYLIEMPESIQEIGSV